MRLYLLQALKFPNFNLSLLHLTAKSLNIFFFPLVLSLEASFLPNISVFFLKPIILVHNIVIFKF